MADQHNMQLIHFSHIAISKWQNQKHYSLRYFQNFQPIGPYPTPPEVPPQRNSIATASVRRQIVGYLAMER
jgi:hypothetical protein